uniref:Kinesin light chain-like n=1 Tax=Saccoglossus kowalevskii TaxID=10224 RepID=A0ABM0M4C0_SACKO|nr:PREDICTED: kinesin light chain-like [Saccoglossus kowalevskii]
MQLVLKNNRTNLDHYLKLMVKLGIVPEIESKKDHRKRMSITLLFEHYLGPNRRIELFHNFAEITKKQGKQIKYCFMRALEADSYMPLAHAHKALQILQEPFKILADLASKGESSSNYDLTLAACEYVQGRSLVMIREVQDGIKMLKKSLETRKKLLKKHTYVARNLNAIGHSYFSIKEIDKSLKYHKQAVEVLYSVATKGIHLDMPTFILNVGTCYHWMGNKAHEDGNKEDGNDFYNKALAEYDKAIILEKDMRIYGFPKTAVVLKNKALTYTEMKEFDKALTLAMEAMEIRMQYLGKEHPDTARSVYFVGSIYLSQGDVARNKAAEEESAEEREKSDRLYNIAHNYLKQALEIELSLEPPRRSIDYENTQSDLKKVLKSLQRHAEIDSYEAVFLKANTEKITTGSDGHDDSSSSSNSGSSESDSEKEDNTMKQKAS